MEEWFDDVVDEVIAIHRAPSGIRVDLKSALNDIPSKGPSCCVTVHCVFEYKQAAKLSANRGARLYHETTEILKNRGHLTKPRN